MKLKDETSLLHRKTPGVVLPVSGNAKVAIAAVCVRQRMGSGGGFVASAPGRLDIMGGIAEYTGAPIVTASVAAHVTVGVRSASDNALSMDFVSSSEAEGSTSVSIPMSALHPDGVNDKSVAPDEALLARLSSDTLRCVFGTLSEMARANLLGADVSGLTVVAASTLDNISEVGRAAALAAATLTATAHLCDVTLAPSAAALLCQRIENRWLGVPVGSADAATALWGSGSAPNQLHGHPCDVIGTLQLPHDVRIVGVDCGAFDANAVKKYKQARCSTAIGHAIIERIIQHDGMAREGDGGLSSVSVSRFVKYFRNRLPTKIRGGQFLDHFDHPNDALACIDEAVTYKPRSRAEHHIYEHGRVGQFVDCLTRAGRSEQGDVASLREAGELMYASHWSYGQRCGLGSVETDALVSTIRRHGAGDDVYGARITARGCGGVVAVLLAHSDRAAGALDAALAAYEAATGHTPRLVDGYSAGAMVAGAQPL